MPAEQPKFRFHGAKKPGNRAPLKAVRSQAAEPGMDGETATIRLYDPIDSWGGDWGVSAKEFANVLDSIPDVTEIRLHVNSPGGEVWEGLAILNQLRQHPANVTTVVDGLAASAASFIACGAGAVVMAPNSQMMIHDAQGIVIGNAADVTEFAGLLNKISGNIADVYAARAGTPAADWRAAMRAETWFNADEAVAVGLADRVDDGMADPQPTNVFDLSIFNYGGRTEAPKPFAQVPAKPTNTATPDENMLTQAMAWFTAVDSIVDEAQEALAAYLNVPSPDPDDTGEADAPAPANSARQRRLAIRDRKMRAA